MNTIESLKNKHELVKNNPYWINFDEKYLPGMLDMFRDMVNNVWGTGDTLNPYYVILRCCTHDVNAMISSIQYMIKEEKEFTKDEFGNVITVLQTFLTNVHALVDGDRAKDDVIGYLFTFDKSGLRKLKSVYDTDKNEWRALNIIKATDIEKVKKLVNHYLKLKDTRAIKQWAIECINDIESGEKIIGGVYMVE